MKKKASACCSVFKRNNLIIYHHAISITLWAIAQDLSHFSALITHTDYTAKNERERDRKKEKKHSPGMAAFLGLCGVFECLCILHIINDNFAIALVVGILFCSFPHKQDFSFAGLKYINVMFLKSTRFRFHVAKFNLGQYFKILAHHFRMIGFKTSSVTAFQFRMMNKYLHVQHLETDRFLHSLEIRSSPF